MNKTTMSPSKTFSRIGLALFITGVLTAVLQLLLAILAGMFSVRDSSFFNSSWYMWLETFIPMYAVGIPVGLLMMKKAPCEHKEPIQLGGKNFFLFLLMCFPLMYGGNIIGTLLSTLLSGGTATNGLFQYTFDKNPLKIIVVVILAPLLEEFLCRKQIIDRCAKYGEKTAILFSALVFGLFHMNLYQFFYAFALGLLFGYVYTRTRRLRYSVIMHMVVNFLGSVLAPLLLSNIDLETFEQMAAGQLDDAALLTLLPSMAGFMLYAVALIVVSVIGLVILITKVGKLVYLPASEELPPKGRFKTVYCNVGVILFVLFCLVFIVLSLIGL